MIRLEERYYHATINYNHGYDKEEENEIDEAVRFYKVSARYGDTDAMSRLGTIFDQVLKPPEPAKAVYWYKRGVMFGDSSCAWNLAMHYAGLGRKRGYLHWLRVADKMGDDDAAAEMVDNAWWKKRNAQQ